MAKNPVLEFDFGDLEVITLEDPAYLVGHQEERDMVAWAKKERFLKVLIWAAKKAGEKGIVIDVERFIEAYRLMGGEIDVY